MDLTQKIDHSKSLPTFFFVETGDIDTSNHFLNLQVGVEISKYFSIPLFIVEDIHNILVGGGVVLWEILGHKGLRVNLLFSHLQFVLGVEGLGVVGLLGVEWL
jgi:hypothetical protein